jgi:hypothetical protein
VTKLDALTTAVKLLRKAGFTVSAMKMYGERDEIIVIIKDPAITLTKLSDGQVKIGMANGKEN